MHQGGDYTSQYYPHHYASPHPNPNPNPNPVQPPFAPAPSYSHSPESLNFSSLPLSDSQNPNPIPNLPPSSASSYCQPQFPRLQPFNPSPFPQEPNPQPYHHLQQPYYPYGSHQPAQNYAPPANPNTNPSPYPSHESPYENPARFDNVGGYFNDTSAGRYHGFGHETGKDGLGDGVYAYNGGKEEPYGARGVGGFSRSSSSASSGSGLKFDDYGRSLSFPSSVKDQPKIVRAVPKMESQEDVKNNGVQKFRVKLLAEGANVTATDVICQIGLDGVRLLDPSTNRTLRIYPLENVKRCEVLDKTILAFWSKSPVDIEPRRVRLDSNSYTATILLDIVTAATVQLEEMDEKASLVRSSGSADAGKPSDETTEKKKGFADWINLRKPGNEEKDHWVPDEAASKCVSCGTNFNAFVRKHHCRNCGDIFCDKCTQGRIALTVDVQAHPVRVCDRCMAEVTQRLSTAIDISSKSTGVQCHEDLARKLQEELEKNRKSSSVSKSSGSGRRMREVACPTCTVHLQVTYQAFAF